MSKVDASILVPRILNEVDREALHHFMDSMSTSHAGETYWVRNLRTKTCKISLPLSIPFVVGVEPYELHQDVLHDLLFEEAFGFIPQELIYCGALCSGEMNGRILDEIILALFEMFDGIFDFENALLPPLSTLSLPYKSDYLTLVTKGRWSEHFEPAFRQMVKGIPGRIVGIPLNGRDWVSHYADARFMRAWITKQYRKVNA